MEVDGELKNIFSGSGTKDNPFKFNLGVQHSFGARQIVDKHGNELKEDVDMFYIQDPNVSAGLFTVQKVSNKSELSVGFELVGNASDLTADIIDNIALTSGEIGKGLV